MNDPLQAKLNVIRQRFVVVLEVREQSILAAVGSLDARCNPRPALLAAQFELHKIAGTAAPLGFPKLGELATDFDGRITAELAATGSDPSHLRAGLVEVLQQISAIRQDATCVGVGAPGVST